MKIKIITDSTSDIPKEIIKDLDIEVVPLTINFSDVSYVDGVDLTGEEFMKKLSESEKLPTTSQVNTGKFIEVFKENLKAHDAIICINISSELSGTYSAAVQAKKEIEKDNIYVVDSRLVSFSLGYVVIEAARMVKDGKGKDEIIEYVNYAKSNMENIFVFDTLEYLLKGGRLSKSEAVLGGILNIKPILTLEDGSLKSFGKIRGKKKVFAYVLNFIKEKYEEKPFNKIAIYENTGANIKEELIKILTKNFKFDEILESEVGSVVSTHSGPGCIAVSFINDNK